MLGAGVNIPPVAPFSSEQCSGAEVGFLVFTGSADGDEATW